MPCGRARWRCHSRRRAPARWRPAKIRRSPDRRCRCGFSPSPEYPPRHASPWRSRPPVRAPPSGRRRSGRSVPDRRGSQRWCSPRHSRALGPAWHSGRDRPDCCLPVAGRWGAPARCSPDNLPCRGWWRPWSPFRYRARSDGSSVDENNGNADRSSPAWGRWKNAAPA